MQTPESTSNTDSSSGDSSSAENTTPVEGQLFAVATHKFIVLSLCTFGIYDRYWSYQNWVRLQAITKEDMSPAWRTVFSPIWNFSLFSQIRAQADRRKVSAWWSAGLLGALYFICQLTWRLPDPLWLAGYASILTFVPALSTVRAINNAHAAGSGNTNSRYSGANIATIVIGGLFFLLGVWGTLFPEQ